MTTLPTYRGARVIAHTVDDTTRRVFEHDGSDFLPWYDMDRQDTPRPRWHELFELLDPVPAPYNPKTGEYLHYVPTDVTIPAGATYYLTTPVGGFYGPFDAGEPYTPTMLTARNTYWTVEPIPEPETVDAAREVGTSLENLL